jgi:hypothetical protein
VLAGFGDLAQALGTRCVVLVFPMRESLEDLLAGGEALTGPRSARPSTRGTSSSSTSPTRCSRPRAATALQALFLKSHSRPRGNAVVAAAVQRVAAPASGALDTRPRGLQFAPERDPKEGSALGV